MIEIRDLYKAFNGQEVLKGVNLKIGNGESHIIIGRSGCGKSVLLKHIIGLLRPDAGEVIVDGVSLRHLGMRELYAVRKKIGMLFQGAALFDSMTVEENIGLAVREHRLFTTPEIKRKIAEKLAMVGLPGVEEKYPAELSGGMRKRVGLARALMMEPDYVLYDEPTTGLDPVMADTINELIIRVKGTMGVTSIVVTHDMVSAYKVGDVISMLHKGQVVFAGSPEEIRNSDNPVVRQFIGGNSLEAIPE